MLLPPMRVGATSFAAISALVVAIWSAPARAQTIDLVSVGAQYMPSAQMAGAPGKVQVASYDVGVTVPVPLAPKTYLFPGLGYHVDAVSFSDTPAEFVQLRAFQGIDASTLLVRLLPNGWSFAARTGIGLAGDFQTVDRRMLRSTSLMSVTHAFSKRFSLGGGALTSFSFGSFLPLPAIYVGWKPFDGAEIESFLPSFVHARYTVKKRVRFGLVAELSGNEYAVRDSRIRDAWPCRGQASDDPTTPFDERSARPSECFDNLAYSVGTAGFSVGIRLVSSVWLTGLVGHSFFRRLDRRNSARELLSDGSEEIPNVLVVRTGLVWRLPGSD
jgi:hypothetical protein